jgi:hypothetical protein
MRTSVRIVVAAVLLAASAGAALAEGPYDDRSYWAKVERWQDCAWKGQYSPYPPAFSYGPAYTCNYGPPAAQYYAPPPIRPAPYRYSYYPYNPYYYR